MSSNEPAENKPQPQPEKKKSLFMTILPSLLFTIGCVAAGIFLYFWFTKLEEEGGNARINFIIAWIYNTFGKTGVLLVALGLAVISICVMIKEIVVWKNNREDEPASAG